MWRLRISSRDNSSSILETGIVAVEAGAAGYDIVSTSYALYFTVLHADSESLLMMVEFKPGYVPHSGTRSFLFLHQQQEFFPLSLFLFLWLRTRFLLPLTSWQGDLPLTIASPLVQHSENTCSVWLLW